MNTARIDIERIPGTTDREALYRTANILALITIFYNLAEGAVSTFIGAGDETIALFGFGLDSFVEVISGVGIWYMIRRSRRSVETQSDFEKNALRVTGAGFYALAAGLPAGAVLNLVNGHKPETTLPGILISLVSILTMWLLVRRKLSTGRALNNSAIIADANCTKTCLYLSFILLASSLAYTLTGFGWLDSIGALGIAWYAWKEGKESFDKVKGIACCGGDCH